MSYPPPPGLASSNQPSSTAPHPSLPTRPTAGFKPAFSATPSLVNGAPGTRGYGNDGSLSRASANFDSYTGYGSGPVRGGSQDWRAHTPTFSNGPVPQSNFPQHQPDFSGGGFQQNQYPYQQQSFYPTQAPDSFPLPTPPQIRNPFPSPGQDPGGNGSHAGPGKDRYGSGGYDPEMEAQIAQWQSAYAGRDDNSSGRSGGMNGLNSAGNPNLTALGTRPSLSIPLSTQEVASAVKLDTGVAAVVHGPDGKQKTVVRSGGGQTWQDSSLLEWDPAHFRLFVGNLAGEVTDESLLKAFSKYDSVQKARVVRDKRTTKSRGYGFVSFSDGDQYFQAAKDMQGKYIGSHPVLIKRSTTEIKATTPADKKKHGKGGKGAGGAGATIGKGIQKKQAKTKGGLKILG